MRDEQVRKGNLEREVPLQPGIPGQVPRSIRQSEVRARIDRHLGIHLRGDREEGVRGRPGSSAEGQGDLGGEGEDRQGRRGDPRAPSSRGPDSEIACPSEGHPEPQAAGEAQGVPRPPVHVDQEQDPRGTLEKRDPEARRSQEDLHLQARRMDALARDIDDRLEPELPGRHPGADQRGRVVPPGGVQLEEGRAAHRDDTWDRILRRAADTR